MKVRELTEQLQRRKSPEELAAMKADPDYWKKGVRKEFNDLLKKYGATSRETGTKVSPDRLNFDRDISVLVTGENSIALHRDTRAVALVKAVAKWLHGYTQKDHNVLVHYYAGAGSRVFQRDAKLEDILASVEDAARVKETAEWLKQNGERGEKMPLRFNLRFQIRKPE